MRLIIRAVVFIFILSCQNKAYKSSGANKNESAINEKSFITLGGEKQYVEITGSSKENPVLLFLHGGPGWPQTPYLRYFNSELTKSMTVVAWEQRGCGKSFMNDPDPKNLSLDQLVNDAHELTQLLKKKFSKSKIFLAGFSWGSIIGLKLIEKYPEDYVAYFGISQVLNLRESIKLSRKWIAEQAEAKGDKKSLLFLNQLDKGDTTICKTELDCFLKQHELLSNYGGAIYKKESETEIQKAETNYEDYKNYDWLAAFNFSASHLKTYMFETDLTGVKELKIPVYFLVGRHDWNLPAQLTEAFVKQLKAPKKEIIWFENSGHEPLEEEANKFNQVIIERVRK